MPPDPELNAMIREVAAMPPPDRERVLGLLGAEAGNKLDAILAEMAAKAYSPDLAALIDEVFDGGCPMGITPLTASTLRELGTVPIPPARKRQTKAGNDKGILDRLIGVFGRGGLR